MRQVKHANYCRNTTKHTRNMAYIHKLLTLLYIIMLRSPFNLLQFSVNQFHNLTKKSTVMMLRHFFVVMSAITVVFFSGGLTNKYMPLKCNLFHTVSNLPFLPKLTDYIVSNQFTAHHHHHHHHHHRHHHLIC